MKRNRVLSRIAAAIISALAFVASIAAANAVQVVLCRTQATTGGSMAGQIKYPNLSTTYAADVNGCVVASGFADVAILRANGFGEPGKERSILFATGVATGTTSFPIVPPLPPGSYIQQIIFSDTTANAAGSVSVGTTSGAADVVAAVALGANSVLAGTLLKTVFSASASLFLTSTGWNSANVSATIILGYY